MLPPGAVISGFSVRFPGTPHELKELMVMTPPVASKSVATPLATTMLPV